MKSIVWAMLIELYFIVAGLLIALSTGGSLLSGITLGWLMPLLILPIILVAYFFSRFGSSSLTGPPISHVTSCEATEEHENHSSAGVRSKLIVSAEFKYVYSPDESSSVLEDVHTEE